MLLLVYLTISFNNKFINSSGYNFVSQCDKQNSPGQCRLNQNTFDSSNTTKNHLKQFI